MTGISVKLLAVEGRERAFRLRMPFRFGVTTATHGRQAMVQVRIALSDGREATGYSAEALGAKWFDKNLELSDEDNHHQLRKSLELATGAYLASGHATPFAMFADHYSSHIRDCASLGLNPLIASYGQSLVDRAIVDAVCRVLEVSYYKAVRTNLLGLAPHKVIGDLGNLDIASFLAKLSPSRSVHVRHTVGLADPITSSDQDDDLRIGDGLPETLEEVVATYGNRYFKIKVCGDEDEDLHRLERIAAVLDRSGSEYLVTLDGNEQFPDARHASEFFQKLKSSLLLERFARTILYVEQPINRANAFSRPVAALASQIPVIIDESDGELSAFIQAKELGYTGVSSKACKGMYKSIINRIRCEIWNKSQNRNYFMSAEDLTCEPGVALQQDLSLVNILGLTHVERNAHHFIDGFGGRSRSEIHSFVEKHADLYKNFDGNARLRIQDGKLDISSLDCAGFGSAARPDFEAGEPMPAAAWPLTGEKDG